MTEFVESADGTRIAFDVDGEGPAVILVAGAIQFRAFDPGTARLAVALAATDPANPYGSALAWPQADGGHRAGRKAGALVGLVDGALSLYVERGGKTLLTFTEDADVLRAAALALVTVIRRGAPDKMALEKVNGGEILDTDIGRALADAGFHTTPKGLRIRA